MSRSKFGRAALVLAIVGSAGSAHAHFILLEPGAEFVQDMSALAGGAPQKGAPCGPGGFDDTGSPMPTDTVTEVMPGDTLQVKWQITVNHAGYFRIALAGDPSEFEDPPFTNATTCALDMAAVPTGPHDNVLVDGISATATMQDVTIPEDPPCTDCYLQVIQVMKDHGPPNCIYYHCAKLKVLTDGGGTGGAGAGGAGAGGAGAGGAGTGGAGAGGAGAGGAGAGASGQAGSAAGQSGGAGVTGQAGSAGGAAGMQATPAAGAGGTAGAVGVPPGAQAPSSSADDSGCAVSTVGNARVQSSLLGLGIVAAALLRRRRRVRARSN